MSEVQAVTAAAAELSHRATRDAGRYVIAVIALHAVAIGTLVTFGLGHPAFLGVGVLAYTLGLRHAFDADHISAIDNVTRKQLQRGKRPTGVGFFFAVGHSAVVLVIAVLLGFASRALLGGIIGENSQLRSISGMIGTSIGASFLILIGLLNLVVFLETLRAMRVARRGEAPWDDVVQRLASGGVMTRLFGSLFRIVEHSWQMIPVGVVFGLGFDTASEVALLSISAGAAAQGLPWLAVVSLPLAFAASMTMMDTANGAFMAHAYSWAFSNAARKIFYNLVMTGLSVVLALFIGVLEIAQVLINAFRLTGGIFAFLEGLNVASMGLIVVATFVGTWLVAIVVYRLRKSESP